MMSFRFSFLKLFPKKLTFLALSIMIVGTTYKPATAGDLYGLIIGINDYIGTENDLAGAVNDANDIYRALNNVGAKKVVRFLDVEATKSNIEKAWFDLVKRAKAGDTIVFTYSGHGSQEPEPEGRNGEEDGLNENFLLAKFDPFGAGVSERIVDDEIFAWMKAADDKGVKVVLVADSCHSGTMHRSIGQNTTVRYRKGKFRDINQSTDNLSYPGKEYATMSESDLQYLTFVGATSDDRLTPEIYINNEVRGALSWSFARAIEGFADRNKDGMVSQLELLGYVIPTVKAQVEHQQSPNIVPIRSASFQLFPTVKQGSDNIITGSLNTGKTRQGNFENLRLYVDGHADIATLSGIEAISVVKDRGQADLIWEVGKATISHKIGGVVAENVNAASARPIIAKWAAIKLLKAKMLQHPVQVSLPRGDQRYRKGELVEVEVKGVRYPYLTLFNLPPDGKVEFFLPHPNRPQDAKKSWVNSAYRQQFRVANPPYGAEHLVAIYSEEILTELHAALANMQTPDKASILRGILETSLKNRKYQVGVLGIYTGK